MLSTEIFVLTIIGVLILVSFPFYMFLGAWVYNDAKERSDKPPILWVLVVLCFSNFIGLIIYLVVGRNKAGVSSGKYKKAAIISGIIFVLGVVFVVGFSVFFALQSFQTPQIDTIYFIPRG